MRMPMCRAKPPIDWQKRNIAVIESERVVHKVNIRFNIMVRLIARGSQLSWAEETCLHWFTCRPFPEQPPTNDQKNDVHMLDPFWKQDSYLGSQVGSQVGVFRLRLQEHHITSCKHLISCYASWLNFLQCNLRPLIPKRWSLMKSVSDFACSGSLFNGLQTTVPSNSYIQYIRLKRERFIMWRPFYWSCPCLGALGLCPTLC